MRCIAYVSRVPVSDRGIRLPQGLSDIVVSSRRFNPLSGITGIISYRRGQYFQVIEGPHHKISSLMSKIAEDKRHEDIWVFLDVRITKRSFENWGVSVFDFVDQGPYFKAFINNNQHIINAFTNEQKERIEAFIELEEVVNVVDEHYSDKRYDGKLLRLKAWPDLNNVSQPQMVIGLCVKLTKKPYAFDQLVSEEEFGSHEQVTQTIRGFEKLGILSISEPVVALPSETAIASKKPNKFYGAIKKFLGIG